jgi:UDP-3-O-acyl N-acetylglucosamine deacetylase
VRYSGIALHTGARAHLTLRPAPAGSGIHIQRTDLPGEPTIPALVSQVVDVRRATTIAAGPAKVHTVEHVLAALYACGVDNAVVAMDSAEPPIADGSSAPFLEAIAQAGIVAQGAPRQTLIVTQPVWYEERGTHMVALPYDGYRISCTVQYGASQLDTQYYSMAVSATSFARDLAAARTFCLYDEIGPLMKAGLIRGGSLDNANIIKDGAIICKETLRYPDELVRHKMLDIVGDLSLVGRRLRGHIIAIKPGHPSNVALARLLAAQAATP